LSIVVDASALAKLVVEEAGSAEVRRVMREAFTYGWSINVPDIALAEALNVLWKHRALLQDLDENEFKEAVKDLLALWGRITVYKSYSLALKSIEIAVKYKITVYDALYLALSIATNSPLLTYDEELRKIAKDLGIAVAP